jgi:hypothetical protein
MLLSDFPSEILVKIFNLVAPEKKLLINKHGACFFNVWIANFYTACISNKRFCSRLPSVMKHVEVHDFCKRWRYEITFLDKIITVRNWSNIHLIELVNVLKKHLKEISVLPDISSKLTTLSLSTSFSEKYTDICQAFTNLIRLHVETFVDVEILINMKSLTKLTSLGIFYYGRDNEPKCILSSMLHLKFNCGMDEPEGNLLTLFDVAFPNLISIHVNHKQKPSNIKFEVKNLCYLTNVYFRNCDVVIGELDSLQCIHVAEKANVIFNENISYPDMKYLKLSQLECASNFENLRTPANIKVFCCLLQDINDTVHQSVKMLSWRYDFELYFIYPDDTLDLTKYADWNVKTLTFRGNPSIRSPISSISSLKHLKLLSCNNRNVNFYDDLIEYLPNSKLISFTATDSDTCNTYGFANYVVNIPVLVLDIKLDIMLKQLAKLCENGKCTFNSLTLTTHYSACGFVETELEIRPHVNALEKFIGHKIPYAYRKVEFFNNYIGN